MHLAGQTRAALEEWARAQGAGPGAARTLARALVSRAAGKPPRPGEDRPAQALLEAARAHFSEAPPRAEAVTDPDGTVRFAVALEDGAIVETVLIHQPGNDTRKRTRETVCVSSQVGCARGCTFCETGRLGLKRNLTAAEIVQQYALAARGLAQPANVVFMGMGEPLDNLDEVLRAIEVLTDPVGFAVPVSRVTVSTVGIVPKLAELYARTRANVAVSLHALEPEARKALLPVARKWPLEELRAAIARSPRPVLLQWTLIEGANDSERDADLLARFALDLPNARVNLIPLNPGPQEGQRAPPLERCRAFQRRLADRGVRALLRMPHGQSIGGACGQLAGARRKA